jgi:hypothetical protein
MYFAICCCLYSVFKDGKSKSCCVALLGDKVDIGATSVQLKAIANQSASLCRLLTTSDRSINAKMHQPPPQVHLDAVKGMARSGCSIAYL